MQPVDPCNMPLLLEPWCASGLATDTFSGKDPSLSGGIWKRFIANSPGDVIKIVHGWHSLLVGGGPFLANQFPVSSNLCGRVVGVVSCGWSDVANAPYMNGFSKQVKDLVQHGHVILAKAGGPGPGPASNLIDYPSCLPEVTIVEVADYTGSVISFRPNASRAIRVVEDWSIDDQGKRSLGRHALVRVALVVRYILGVADMKYNLRFFSGAEAVDLLNKMVDDDPTSFMCKDGKKAFDIVQFWNSSNEVSKRIESVDRLLLKSVQCRSLDT